MNTELLLSLGSNLGDRLSNLAAAVDALNKREIFVKECSAIYETSPVDCPNDSPAFLNSVIKVETKFSLKKIINLVLEIEKNIGRNRSTKNAPRVIDIDILLANNIISENENIIIPHPRMCERLFVLEPMREIAADFIHPILQKSIKQIYIAAKNKSSEKIKLFAPSFSYC